MTTVAKTTEPTLPEPDEAQATVLGRMQDGKDALAAGDRIEYAVTHELNVDGSEKAWVKYGVNSTVSEGETAEQATERLVRFVNTAVIQAATSVADQVMRG